MCDYSLHHVNSRPAKIGDRLTMTSVSEQLFRVDKWSVCRG